MEIKIKFSIDLKTNNLCYEDTTEHSVDSDSINGYYIYNDNSVVVNLTSRDFKDCDTEDELIETFGVVVTHEATHSAIYKITGTYATEGEELIIEGMLK